MNEYLEGFCTRAVSADPAGTPIPFVISTSGVKRDGLDLNPANFIFNNFMRNPVVLWSHDMMGFSNPPIGRVTSLTVEDDRILADIVFDSGDPFAANVERKYRNGFLNAVSISWNTTRGTEGGVEIITHELLEVSAVTVPADPDALIVRQQQGLKRVMQLIDATLVQPVEDTPELALVWEGIRSAMVALYSGSGLDADQDTRSNVYQALVSVYRALGKTPPEFLSGDTLRALDQAQWSGVFLSNEVDHIETADYESNVLEQARLWLNQLEDMG